jgi:hypothetical protein
VCGSFGGLKKFKLAAVAMIGNAILNFINMPKASTHYGEYSYNVS